MAKPSVVQYVLSETNFSRVRGEEPSVTMMRQLNGNYGVDADDKSTFPDDRRDYDWFVWPEHDIEVPELQVFYEKNFTPVRFDEFRAFIEKALSEPQKDKV